MNPVTYTARNTNETNPLKISFTCTENKAYKHLENDLAAMKHYGYNTASGDGWFTATNTKTGDSLTCTITH